MTRNPPSKPSMSDEQIATKLYGASKHQQTTVSRNIPARATHLTQKPEPSAAKKVTPSFTTSARATTTRVLPSRATQAE